MTKTSILVVALLAGLNSAALGAQATQDGADRLKGVFERYLGPPSPGQAGSVTVTPEGAAYRAKLDLQRVAQPFAATGFSLDPATMTLLLTPNDDGTWRVTADSFPALKARFKDQTIATESSSYKFAGTFDPKIPGFSEGTTAQDGWTLDQDAPALTQRRRVGHVDVVQRATTDGGTATVDTHYGVADLTDQITVRVPPPKASVEVAPAPPATEFGYKVPAGTGDLSMSKLHMGSLLDLWAFFVGHPNRDAMTASQDELRGLLRAALPLFAGLKASGSLDRFELTTQVGAFSVQKLANSFELADLSGSGRAAVGVTFSGLVVPKAGIPPWALDLLPTALDIHSTVTGFHFDEAAKEAVEDFDLKQADVLTRPQREKIGHLAWPDQGKLILGPSRITSTLLDLRMEGEASIGSVPSGHLTVTGTGLDAAIGALQHAAGTDPTAGQILAQFVAAKNLGKPGPDGSFVWVIEAAGDGPLSINGIPLK